jgi:hypothetical protein
VAARGRIENQLFPVKCGFNLLNGLLRFDQDAENAPLVELLIGSGDGEPDWTCRLAGMWNGQETNKACKERDTEGSPVQDTLSRWACFNGAFISGFESEGTILDRLEPNDGKTRSPASVQSIIWHIPCLAAPQVPQGPGDISRVPERDSGTETANVENNFSTRGLLHFWQLMELEFKATIFSKTVPHSRQWYS